MRRHKSTTYRHVKRKVEEDLEGVEFNYDCDAEYSSSSEEEVRDVDVEAQTVEPSSNPGSLSVSQSQEISPDVSFGSLNDLCDENSWDLSELSLSYSSDSSSQSSNSVTPQPCLVSDSENGKPPAELAVQLRKWAVGNNISNSSLTKLLHIVQPLDPSLPKDARTLLNIRPVQNLIKMGKGLYYNFGLEAVILNVIRFNPTVTSLKLSFNIDGLPLFKSTKYECWPILFLVNDLSLPPMMSAVWCGPGKPPLRSYFKDFVPELRNLLDNGTLYKGHQYSVEVKAFICDAPAVAFVKGVVGHTSYYGCGKCLQKGYFKGRMTFPVNSADLRTDESFRAQSQPDHHSSDSPLLGLNIDMVDCFPLDYLHLICLGVVRRTLMWLLKGCKGVRRKQISNDNLTIINERLCAAGKFWPREFSRRPRSLDDIKRWKAVEFRQFVLYLVVVVFRGNVLSPRFYNHFALLHIACSLLCRNDLSDDMIEAARAVLLKFLSESRRLFGVEFISYNVHNLIHLPDCCKLYGKLDNFSAFPFENELNVLKHAIRGKTRPLQQLVGRYTERSRELLLEPRATVKPNGVVTTSSHKKGPTLSLTGTCFYKVFFNNRPISLLPGDNIVTLKTNVIVMIQNFISTLNGVFLIGTEFKRYRELYKIEGVSSSDLGICIAEHLSERRKKWPLEAILHKCVAIPINRKDSYAVFPLT